MLSDVQAEVTEETATLDMTVVPLDELLKQYAYPEDAV
jgi:hypothetical protein